MTSKPLVVGLILVYFIIAVHLTLKIDGVDSFRSSVSRWKRQIPFFSSWWGSSSTNKPDNVRRSSYHGSSKQGHSSNSYVSFLPDKLPSYQNRSTSTNNGKGVSERDSRFLSLFTLVKFDNSECLSTSGDNGTCFPQAECYRRGGAVNGRCAKGYGACCVFSKTCGASTNQNGTYFTHNGLTNPGGSFDGTGSCQLTVYKCSPDVCQLRLDFDSFVLAQPSINGICNNDQFIVSGASTAVPIICGVNTGNHMYIDVGVDNSPVTISMVTSGPTYSRSWKIKITQIKCRDLGKAPEGCLQYYRGVSGVIRSYNFDFTSGQQLSNQDYTSCVRVERNFCGIRYTACNDNVQFSNIQPTTTQRSRAFFLTGQGQTGSVTGANQCPTDWITIPCATNSGRTQQSGGAVCQDRICGDVFNSETSTNPSPVYSYVKPFRIHYHTDGNETGDTGNRGYCLNYIQQPCSIIR
ncbi:uncharacterized protein LOC110845489 [Folsomia candida]|uniref:CUB domain-containing protein n=1 Tax=Folsomia candida TaxID=158441 RepID=A0A226ELE8_FOLCA|nr:uncharacterized protein LOC110845489 [Folsomia candida]OXA57396.1 hypothetical protein Fcan01_06390 [Folsomia candida]